MREKFHVINGRFDCSKHMDFLFSHKALTRFEMDTIEKAEGSAAMVSTHITPRTLDGCRNARRQLLISPFI